MHTGKKVETHIYYKETERKQYLFFISRHPHYTKVNIPFRFRVIVSDEVKLMQRFNELNKILLKQKDPEQYKGSRSGQGNIKKNSIT